MHLEYIKHAVVVDAIADGINGAPNASSHLPFYNALFGFIRVYRHSRHQAAAPETKRQASAV